LLKKICIFFKIETVNTIKNTPSESYILSLESYNLNKKFKLTCTEPGLIQKSAKIWVKEGVLHVVGLCGVKLETGAFVTKHLSKAFVLPHGIVYERVTAYFNKYGQLVIELPCCETTSTLEKEKQKKNEEILIKLEEDTKYEEKEEERIWKMLERLELEQVCQKTKPSLESKYEWENEEIRKQKYNKPECFPKTSFLKEENGEKIWKYLERSDSQVYRSKPEWESIFEREEKQEKRSYDWEVKEKKRDTLHKPKRESMYEWEDLLVERNDISEIKCEEKAEYLREQFYKQNLKAEHRESKYVWEEKKEKETGRREYIDLLGEVAIYDFLMRK
jgi:hypothetical protein